MTENIKIHIFGASGSGVTTLGKNLSLHFKIPFFDSDDYYWQKTDPPFQKTNPPEIRQTLLSTDLAKNENWILSGSLVSWGDFLRDEFTLGIYLYVPREERIARIKAREKKRFGQRIEAGGDMHEGHTKFLDWAHQYDEGHQGGRSKPLHDEWMSKIERPLLKIEGTFNEKEILEKVLDYITRHSL